MEGKGINIKTAFFEHFLPIFIGILLIVCGFLAGWYWKNLTNQASISVTLAPEKSISTEEKQKIATNESAPTIPVVAPSGDLPAGCSFVASKKGTKYHSGTSRVAKQIKPENLLCFTDKETAEKSGLTPGVLE